VNKKYILINKNDDKNSENIEKNTENNKNNNNKKNNFNENKNNKNLNNNNKSKKKNPPPKKKVLPVFNEGYIDTHIHLDLIMEQFKIQTYEELEKKYLDDEKLLKINSIFCTNLCYLPSFERYSMLLKNEKVYGK